MPVVKALVVPGIPHPLLCPEENPGWQALRDGFEAARVDLLASGAERLVVYSTLWPSIIGHQVQARAEPEWVHVDEVFHALGSIPYRFRIDVGLAGGIQRAAVARGLACRTVDYHGFPIDTGSVVALRLLTPDNEIPSVIVSSNIYADRAETVVFGKAARDAIDQDGVPTAVCVVSTLSNRLFTDLIAPEQDRIHSAKDDEWNRKILEFAAAGRLEDLAQLSREIHRQVRVPKVVSFKPFWWLSAVAGQHNRYDGRVFAYGALHGSGAAVVAFTPSTSGLGDREFDEDEVEVYRGDRDVLSGAPTPAGPKAGPAKAAAPAASMQVPGAAAASEIVAAYTAPKAVGAYPHARRVGDLLYLSGMGPRQVGTDAIPGGPIRDAAGQPRDYDIRAQTRAVLENVKAVLEAAGSSLEKVVDVTSFLVDMDRDFDGYNEVYAEYLGSIRPTRTTVSVRALPTPIAVELKVVALP